MTPPRKPTRIDLDPPMCSGGTPDAGCDDEWCRGHGVTPQESAAPREAVVAALAAVLNRDHPKARWHDEGEPSDPGWEAWACVPIPAVFAALAAAPLPSDTPADPSRAELWEKFTGGEKLAYGCGYRDAKRESDTPADGLDALREATRAVVDQMSSEGGVWVGIQRVRRWRDDLRAALALTREPPKE